VVREVRRVVERDLQRARSQHHQQEAHRVTRTS
jgi:hypothetical protein